jgi:hypothetical protein
MAYRLKTALRAFAKDVYRLRWIILGIAAYCVTAGRLFGTVCPVRILTGWNCPGCGLTRGSVCVLTGRWRMAFSYNPASFAWVALIAWLLYRRYFCAGKKTRWEFPVIIVSLGTIFLWIWHAAEFFAV